MESRENNFCATLLDFVAPLLGSTEERLPHDLTKDILTFTITVWNAHAMALPAWNHPEHLEQLDAMLAQPDAEDLRSMYAQLKATRQERYRLDARVVGEWDLKDGDDGTRRLRAELRMPGPRVAEMSEAEEETTKAEGAAERPEA